MIVIESQTDDYELMEMYIFSYETPTLSIGHSKDKLIVGVCFLDKYCWTNIFGFEKLI